MKCKEYRDDLIAITAVPVAKISNTASVMLVTAPTVDYDFSQHFDEDTIVIGMSKARYMDGDTAMAVGSLIPIKNGTGKVKDNESDGVAGRLHTVSVNCEADDRDSDAWNSLLQLERTPSHLLLTFRDNSRAFVHATEDSYVCQVERDGGKTSVSFNIQNLTGIQLITD